MWLKAVAAALCAVLLFGCARARKPKPVPAPFRPPAMVKPAPPEYLLTDSAPPLAWEPPMFAAFLQALALPPLPPPPKPKPLPPPVITQPPSPPPSAPSFDLELRPLLTPAQARELERQTNERLARARSALRSIEGRTLTREQSSLLSQVRTFIEQAEQARRNDLPRARNLAERAEVLALDLARQLSR